MRRPLLGPVGLVILLALGAGPAVRAQSDQADRVREAAVVLQEMMDKPDQAIPASVLGRAEGLAVFPSTLKGGFIVGAHRGRGIISVRRQEGGGWSPPAFLTLTGGSFGAQIGGQAVDIVLVIMNRRGLENLLQNEFKIGGDAAVTVGPVGRDAEASTDLHLRAEMLSYSRSRGLFVGVTLKGSSVREDLDANERFYGRRLRTRQVVLDGDAPAPQSPDALGRWMETLRRHMPNASD